LRQSNRWRSINPLGLTNSSQTEISGAAMDKFLVVIHLVGMALAIGSGFSILALKIGSADMDKAEREPYMLRGFAVTNIGAVGIALLFVSGAGMLICNGTHFAEIGGVFFYAKGVLFALYFIAFVVLRMRVSKARLTNGGPLMVHMSKFVIVMNMLSVMTIVASVLAFHGK